MTVADVHHLIDTAWRVPVPAAATAEADHPLAHFIELDDSPRPPRMVIPGVVQDGVIVIAGAQGTGKTTVLVPLSMIAAGLHGERDPLAPWHWRHVVYISEDDAQVQRIVSGVMRHAGLGLDKATVRERFHLVAAKRLSPDEVAAVGPILRARFTRTVAGVELPPLVVFDTKSAIIEVDDENSNAEAARIVSLFKQQFNGLPLWIVGHVAKALTTRKDVQSLSTRGAGAIEADAHQTVFLVVEGDGDDSRRFLVLGKRRFEPKWPELEVLSASAEVGAVDEFGQHQTMVLRWGWPSPPSMTRAEAQRQAREREADEVNTALRGAILDAVDEAWSRGQPISASGLRGVVRGRVQDINSTVAVLEDESWLVSIDVPRDRRVNNNKGAYLVRLQDDERRAWLAGAGLSPAKAAIPPSWARPIPSVPAAGTDEADGGSE